MPPQPKKRPPLSEITKRFNLPLMKAAEDLGICQTLLKKFCREYQITRWPYRKMKSLFANPASEVDLNFIESPEDQQIEESHIQIFKPNLELSAIPTTNDYNMRRNSPPTEKLGIQQQQNSDNLSQIQYGFTPTLSARPSLNRSFSAGIMTQSGVSRLEKQKKATKNLSCTLPHPIHKPVPVLTRAHSSPTNCTLQPGDNSLAYQFPQQQQFPQLSRSHSQFSMDGSTNMSISSNSPNSSAVSTPYGTPTGLASQFNLIRPPFKRSVSSSSVYGDNTTPITNNSASPYLNIMNNTVPYTPTTVEHLSRLLVDDFQTPPRSLSMSHSPHSPQNNMSSSPYSSSPFLRTSNSPNNNMNMSPPPTHIIQPHSPNNNSYDFVPTISPPVAMSRSPNSNKSPTFVPSPLRKALSSSALLHENNGSLLRQMRMDSPRSDNNNSTTTMDGFLTNSNVNPSSPQGGNTGGNLLPSLSQLFGNNFVQQTRPT